MRSSTRLESPYSLEGVEFRKLLNRVANRSLSPEQAEQQVDKFNQRSTRLFIAASRGLMGLLVLGVGLFLLRQSWQTNAKAQALDNRLRETVGTVVELVRRDRANDGPTYTPVFTYWVAGKTYQNTGDVAATPTSFSVGESVTVKYDPTRPESGTIDTFVNRWVLVLILGVPGTLLTVLGLAVLWSLLATILAWSAPADGPTPSQLQRVLVQLAAGQLTVDEAERQLQPRQATARTKSSPGWRVFLLLFLGLFLFLSIQQISQAIRLIVSGERAEGKVVSFMRTQKSGVAPLIRYRVGEQEYDYVGPYSTNVDKKLGDSVPVLYNPDQPAEAKVRSFGVLVSGPLFGLLIILVVGGALIGLPYYTRYQSRITKK